VEKVHINGESCKENACTTEMNTNNQACYRATCYATTRLLANKLRLAEDQYTVCFQSRLNKKWLMPFSDKVVEDQGKKGTKKILAFSPAFVADCLETVIEIGDEYQEIFTEAGGEKIQLVPSSNDHDRFVDCLEELIRDRM